MTSYSDSWPPASDGSKRGDAGGWWATAECFASDARLDFENATDGWFRAEKPKPLVRETPTDGWFQAEKPKPLVPEMADAISERRTSKQVRSEIAEKYGL